MAHARGSTPRLCLALHQKGISSTTETMSTATVEVPPSYPYPELRMPEEWEMNQLVEEEYEAYCRDVLRDSF